MCSTLAPSPTDELLMVFVRWHYRSGIYVRSHYRRHQTLMAGRTPPLWQTTDPLQAARGMRAARQAAGSVHAPRQGGRASSTVAASRGDQLGCRDALHLDGHSPE